MELKSNQFRAACRGCHGGCIHICTVENGRLVKVEPDPEGPLNKGKGCIKGLSVIEQMYHADRITYPMKRTGPRGSGHWERITWDEAYGTIATRLLDLTEKYGAECISTITGTGRHHLKYLRRFTEAIGSPNLTSSGALICLGPRRNAGYSTSGAYCSVDYYGETQPGSILVWGANPAVSGADGELQWHPKRCLANGTKFVVIDPQYTELAKHADVWLRIRPGTDGALALGMINIIIEEDLYDHEFVDNWTFGFDKIKERAAKYSLEKVAKITWLSKEDILKAVHILAENGPIGLEWGCAFEQSYNATQTCRSVFMIPALLGSYDVPGGFVESKEIDTHKKGFTEPGEKILSTYSHTRLRAMAHPHMVLNAIRTARPYKVRALLSFANNCLLSLPDSEHTRKCLEELEFFVYMDFFMTPTGELADIFLPAALWPELDCVFAMPEYAEHTLLCQQKLVRVGECKADEEVFAELCTRMGCDYGADTQEELISKELAEMAENHPEMKGLTLEKLRELGSFTPERTYYNYKKRGGFNTPSGKYEFYSLEMEQNMGTPLPDWEEPPMNPVTRKDLTDEYPYILTTGGRVQQYFISNNRQILSLRNKYPFPLVKMHPDTAAQCGLKEGDWAYIETTTGRITQKVSLRPEMDPKVINCDFAWWYPEAGAPDYGYTESNSNMLTTANQYRDPYMGSYQLRGLMCTVYPNPECKIEERFYSSKYFRKFPVDRTSNSVVYDPNKCILCRACVEMCQNTQTVKAIDINIKNDITRVLPTIGSHMSDSPCVGCGQCTTVCPTGAMHLKSALDRVKDAIADPETLVVTQVAPSVRVGISESFGLSNGENCMNRLTSALKKVGFDAVYDTTFSADLTIVEEVTEFAERLKKNENLPIFTSCCPAWVRFCENRYPDLAHHISTCRSPQQMLGAVLQRTYDDPAKREGKKVVFVSIMPCLAKKDEIKRKESTTDGRQDVDYVLASREIVQLLRENDIDLKSCEETLPDTPYGTGSGGGEIFGITGGVTEAALRYLLPDSDPKTLAEVSKAGMRGNEGIKEFAFPYGGKDLRIAVASGLGNADILMQRMRQGEHFDLIEIMACPGGCVMGGGQPADVYTRRRSLAARTEGLSESDLRNAVRRTNDNPEIGEAYANIIHSENHHLLHRNFGV